MNSRKHLSMAQHCTCRATALSAATGYVDKSPVLLSVCGWQESHSHNVSFVNYMQSEQIYSQLTDVQIYQVVLDLDRTISQEGKGSVIGSVPPLGFPTAKKPKRKWLNNYAASFYNHLPSRNLAVTHIVAHAPYFAWGAIEIKRLFYNNAKLVLVMHEYSDCDNTEDEDELEKWAKDAHKIVAIGDPTYQDLRSHLIDYEHKLVCYHPVAPTVYSNIHWTSPHGTKTVVILDSPKEMSSTEDSSDFNVDMAISALSESASILRKTSVLRAKLKVYLFSSCSKEKYTKINNIDVKVHDISSADKLVKMLKTATLCILPLHCGLWSFCVKALIPLSMGIPTLVTASAGVIHMLEAICKAEKRPLGQYLRDVVVDVASVKDSKEEMEAWREAITKKLTTEESAIETARIVKTLVCDNNSRSNLEFIQIFKNGMYDDLFS